MHQLRTIFGIADDLQDFAQEFLNSGGILSHAISQRQTGNNLIAVLHRDGQFQVEMFVIPGGFVINPHRHPNTDTIEVPISGLVRLNVNGVEPFAKFSDEALKKMRWRGLRINHDDMHGGTVAEGGAMFLSIQRWVTKPTSVQLDYIGASNSEAHARLRNGQS